MAHFHDADTIKCFMENNQIFLEKCKKCLKCEQKILENNQLENVCCRELNHEIVLQKPPNTK